jgi:hypothetical protein
MKHCSRCDKDKPTSDFGSNKAKKDGLQTFCKECACKYASGHYKKEEVKEKHLLSVSERRKIVKQRNRELVLEYLQSHPCVDCQESDPIVLEFDHQRDKRMGVARLIQGGYPEKTILDEIEKCEVRCANCHRRKTAKDQGWFKLGDVV